MYRHLNKQMPYFSVPLLNNNCFDAAFSSRIIVFPVETLFNECNWCAKDLLLDWNFMFPEFLFLFPFAGKCDVPIGLEDRRVPDQLITASSFYNYYCAPWNARLRQRRVGRLGGAWCAKRSDRRQWLKVDLGGLTRVSRIATQGRQNSDQWVTSYYVSYSTKGYHFITYKENRRTKVSER